MYSSCSVYLNDMEKALSFDFSPFKGKSILITGASGLIGRFAVDCLMYLNRKYDYKITIVAIFSSPSSAESCSKDYGKDRYFHILIHDITHPLPEDISPDYIIHAASNTHPLLFAEHPVETMKLNVLGTMNVLELAVKNPKSRCLFLSTGEVYGEDLSKHQFKENDYGYVNFSLPRSCYPESKRAAETLCQSYKKEFGVNVVLARLCYIYGPTVKMSSSQASVQFLERALKHEDILLKSKGEQKRSYCYVADAVSALFYLLLHGENGEAYNIASRYAQICLRDFAEELARQAGVNVIVDVPPSEVERQGGSKVSNSTLDPAKLESLGWKSQFTLEEGVAHTLNIKREL